MSTTATDLAPAARLRQQQLQLAAAVAGHAEPPATSPACSPGQAPEHAPQHAPQHAPVGQLLAPGQAGPAGLAVYQSAYTARLVGALRDNFDVLARALGDSGFDALGRAYLAAHPSPHASIRWFGDRLTRFMAGLVDEDDALVPHPALVDLARMDWALRQAFDAADAPVLDSQALGAVPPQAWPGLRWQLHPSVQLLDLQWAVAPAWHALRHAQDDAEPALPPPQASAHMLLVWRRGLDTQWRVLGDSEAALLALARDGGDFSAQCALAAAGASDADQAVPRVVAAVQQWLADGLLSATLG